MKKALQTKPDHATFTHLIASIIGKTPKSPPREYVEELFDGCDAKFEDLLVEKLEYRTTKIIADIIIKTHPNKALGSVLDLGCGTGLAGVELKQFCQKLEGIAFATYNFEKTPILQKKFSLLTGVIAMSKINTSLQTSFTWVVM